jgi:hypothetical protein
MHGESMYSHVNYVNSTLLVFGLEIEFSLASTSFRRRTDACA